MNRRKFVKSTTIGALGATMIAPLEVLAESGVTHLESEDLSAAAKADTAYGLHFLAIGDWGRNGEYLQLEVAKQMGQWAAAHPNNFVISVGDNFYPKGVVSEHDPLLNFSFENIYTAHSLQCDWYPVLGNHDYGSEPDAQIRYSKVSRRWNMPARYYAKEVGLGTGNDKVLFVFIDTQPIVYQMKEQEPGKQIEWLRQTLKQASADVKWKVVVGHHPHYTVGPRIKNYDTLAIRKALAPVFEEHKVDIYLAGHDHSLQHLKPEGYTNLFISGAGSELTPVTGGVAYSRFEASENGYMYFSVNAKQFNMKAINYKGSVLYETTLTK
jgi:tartrate-resistant acid phosphatase type 5